MANPSLKNGYISIATELVEKLATIAIPSSEMRIVWVVWRKTWGWKEGNRRKDWDWISFTQFERLTTMKHGNVGKYLKSLVVKRILLKSENGYKFNQNYEEWGVYKRIPPVVKRILPSMQTNTESGSQTHTYNRDKETNTKETIVEASSTNNIFSLLGGIKKLEDSPRRELNIIALFFEHKKPDLRTNGQFQEAISRHIKPAIKLKKFDDDQIIDAIPKAKKVTEEWTLETLLKYVTK